MTVGEKIQFYRKKSGLSQEELGQRLFVSRQTISLWEMDKTLPTLDNLIRLKEIFSVSIDDILSESEPVEKETQPANETEPSESYQFQYSKDDLRTMYKFSMRPVVIKFIIFVVIYALLIALIAASDAPDALLGILLGLFLALLVVFIKTLVTTKKTWTAQEKLVLDNTYHYAVYDDHFVVNISRNGEITKTHKIYFAEIAKISLSGKFLNIQYGGYIYIFVKDSLIENSRLLAYCESNPDKIEKKDKKSPLSIVSALLAIFSILSIFGAMICAAFLINSNHLQTDNMWVFFLFTPIPIASIIFGCWSKKKGKKHKGNVIIGIIMTVLLCLYGSFTFIFANTFTHDDGPILRIEELLSIDIPEHVQINTQDWTKGTQSTSRGYIYSTSDVYFDEDAVHAFEYSMLYDYRWINVIPNDLVGVTSAFCDSRSYDYFIIYNVDTGEFNQLPTYNGLYRFINVLYNAQSNTMKIVEYEIEYVNGSNLG